MNKLIMVDIDSTTDLAGNKLPSVNFMKICANTRSGHDCKYCNLRFVSKADLSLHQTFESRKFSCPACFLLFTSSQGMKQHFGKKHAKAKPYRCSICQKKFKNIYAVRTHKQQVHMHRNRQMCPKCNKTVFNKFSLSRHLEICKEVTN